MNSKVKEGLSKVVKGIANFFNHLFQSLISIARICVLSSINVARKSKHYSELKGSKSCSVLGTGPSLKDDFDHDIVLTDGVDVMCVNMFCLSPLFRTLKPRFYFLIDGAYFSPKTERHQKMIEGILDAFNAVDWEMYLFVSTSSVSGGPLLKGIKNDCIKCFRLNSTEVDGFRDFRHWIYSHRLGMPRCQTVVNFALCAAINMGYENIFLYGADHTWTRDLFVDDENVVCYGDRHVYNKNLTIVKKKENFSFLLKCFAKMFDAHYLLEQYSRSRGVTIYNCSSDTFLDAYKRYKR